MNIKNLLVACCLIGAASQANAQQQENNFLNHVAIGVSAGTTGIGFDVAVPVASWIQVRAGYDFVPSIKVSTDLDISAAAANAPAGINVPSSVEVEGKVNFGNAKVLIDLYPFKSSSFRVTAGAYIGSKKVIKAYNKQDGALQQVTDYNNWAASNGQSLIGVELGDYLLKPDQSGNMDAYIETQGFKPYLGIGFGRAVPKKRIGFSMDLGVQFWGSPKVFCQDEELKEENAGGDGGVIKTLSKITVYPVLNFRLSGRIL